MLLKTRPKAKGDMVEVGLAAYTDRLSGRPGDTIKFHVSSASASDGDDGKISARLSRCICADPNPAGPGCIEEDASRYFAPREIDGRYQRIRAGSFGRSRDEIDVPDGTKCVSVDIWLFPTHTGKGSESLGSGGALDLQCVWSWGKLGLYMTDDGCLSVCHDGDYLQSTSEGLTINKWYHCTVIVPHAQSGSSCFGYLVIKQQGKISKKKDSFADGEQVSRFTIDPKSKDIPLAPLHAHFELAAGGTFNGRLEDPRIVVSESSNESIKYGQGNTLIRWDSSKTMSEWTIPADDASAIGKDNPLILYNHPTRGVRGRRWNGTEFNWKHRPSHYGGIHFHDDDIYDFGWECDMEWKIPSGIPSGIYLMTLTNGADKEESLPLFICPPLAHYKEGDEKKKLCVLISTFTYVMYGNHARSDFNPKRWMDRTKEWNAYPHNPCQYPSYGLSTYNYHKDQHGICFASHLRPLFNLRPKYLTFGECTCSGLRHFPADTHLIAFLHHNGIDYDIITDHELHKDGVAAIEGYQTMVTGSHPEYHTKESLDSLQEFRDVCFGNLIYLGGNGFYWRVAAMDENASVLEIRRAEGGVRTWASEPGEYHHMVDGGSYGGLWRRNDRPPQQLVGVGFTAQGLFEGMPYRRVCHRREVDWLFEGVQGDILGDFGFSGNGAAGFELDRMDPRLDGGGHESIIVAQAFDKENRFMLVPEEVLTTYSNLSGIPGDEARRADMVYIKRYRSQVFSVGSITFCGSLPWNRFDNNISAILLNVINRFSSDEKIIV